jgi:glycosyltransferase involved in cell wall biosynthesis
MKIGVSGWRLAGQPMGVVRYVEYLIKHWGRQLREDEHVTLFVREALRPTFPPLSRAMDVRVIRPRLTNALWENLLLPLPARRMDVLFGPSYTLPLTHGGRSVVAIHSVNEVVGFGRQAWREFLFSERYRLSARRAARVIVNSESTKERVHERYGVPLDRIDAIWLGADEVFRPIDDPERLRATRVQYLGDDVPYVLFVGGLSERRNVPMLLQAFSLLKQRHRIPHKLLFVGSNRAGLPLDRMSAQLGIADAVVQTDGRFAHHGELTPIYNAADVFVLPSSSEGFSLTLAEAMSCGTPVVTVNQASLGEVAHGYALTIDVPEVEALADALHRVITSDDLTRQLRAKSLERAKAFRWEDTANRTLEVLRRVAAA